MYEDIQSEISDLDIGVLGTIVIVIIWNYFSCSVNNVGMGSGWPDMFGNHDKNVGFVTITSFYHLSLCVCVSLSLSLTHSVIEM